jgi:CRP/FNR family cyclic AMP-dependent transcriptional regulator
MGTGMGDGRGDGRGDEADPERPRSQRPGSKSPEPPGAPAASERRAAHPGRPASGASAERAAHGADGPDRETRASPGETTRTRLLANSPLFAGLDSTDIRAFAKRTRLKRVPRGEKIYFKGDEAHELYTVVDGRVSVTTPSSDGRELVVQDLGEGAIFGETGVFAKQPHSATARAAEDTDLLVFDFRDLRADLERRPRLAMKMLELLAQKLQRTTQKLEDNTFLSVEARIAKTLLRLAEERGRRTDAGLRVMLTMSQTALAEMAGTVRERVNRQLAAWEKTGVIRRRGAVVEVIDVEALRSSLRG